MRKGLKGIIALAGLVLTFSSTEVEAAHTLGDPYEQGEEYIEGGYISWWSCEAKSSNGNFWHTTDMAVQRYVCAQNLGNLSSNDWFMSSEEATAQSVRWNKTSVDCGSNRQDTRYSISVADVLNQANSRGWISAGRAEGQDSLTVYLSNIITMHGNLGSCRAGTDSFGWCLAHYRMQSSTAWHAALVAHNFSHQNLEWSKYYDHPVTISIPTTRLYIEYRDAKSGKLMSQLGGSFTLPAGYTQLGNESAMYWDGLSTQRNTTLMGKVSRWAVGNKVYLLTGVRVYNVSTSVGFDANRAIRLYDDAGNYTDDGGMGGTLAFDRHYVLSAEDRQHGVIVTGTDYVIAGGEGISRGQLELDTTGSNYTNPLYSALSTASYVSPGSYAIVGNSCQSAENTWIEYFYTEVRPNFKLYWNKEFTYTDSKGVVHSRETAVSQLTYDVYDQDFSGHVNEDSVGYDTQTFIGELGTDDQSGYSNRYYVWSARLMDTRMRNTNVNWYGNGNLAASAIQGTWYWTNDYYGSSTFDKATVVCPQCGATVPKWHVAKCAQISNLKCDEQVQVRYYVKPPQIELYYVKQDDGTYQLWKKSSQGSELTAGYGLQSFNLLNSGGEAHAQFQYQQKLGDYEVYNLASVSVYRLAGADSVKYYNGNTDAWVDGKTTTVPTNSVSADFEYRNTNGTELTGVTKSGNQLKVALAEYQKNADKILWVTTNVDARPVAFVAVYEQQPVLEVRSYYYYNPSNTNDTLNFNLDTSENNQKMLSGTGEVWKRLLPADWNGKNVAVGDRVDGDNRPIYQLDGVGDQVDINYTSGAVTLQLLKIGWRGSEATPSDWSPSTGAIGSTTVRPATLPLGLVRSWCGTWNDNAGWKMKVANYNLLVKVYGPRTPDMSVVKYFNTEYPFSGKKVVYERIGEVTNVFVAFGFDGLLPYTFPEKVLYEYSGETLSTTLSNTGYVQIPVSDMKNLVPVLPTKVYDLEGTPSKFENDTFSYSWLNSIQWSKSSADSAERPTNPVSVRITPDREEDAPTHTFIGIYKADKAYTKVAYVRNADGSYQRVDSPVVTDLNVNTKEIRVGFEEYLEWEGQLYQLVNVGDNVKEDSSWQVPSLPVSGNTLAGFTWTVGGSDEAGELVDANEVALKRTESGVTGGSVTDGISAAVGNNEAHKVWQKKLVVCGVYARVDTNGSQDPFTTRDEYLPFHQFTPEQEGTDSAERVMLPSVASFQSEILNNLEYSSDEYVAELSIPSSEYVRTVSSVPKYLVNGEFGKRIVSKDYHLYSYETKNYVYSYKDEVGNLVTVHKGILFSDEIPVNRTNHFWYLAGANVYVPKDATVYNDALPDVTTLDGTPYVKMTAQGNSCDTDTLGFTRVQDGGIAILDYEDSELSIDHGLEEVVVSADLFNNDASGAASVESAIREDAKEWQAASGLQARQEEAEAQIGSMYATNATVTFCNGEPAQVENAKGEVVDNVNTFVLLQRTDYSAIVRDPVNPPLADQTEETVFNSNNAEETKVLQIPEKESNGEKESHSTVHYELKYSSDVSIPYNREGSVETGTDLLFGVFVNDVVVHTPVHCEIVLEGENKYDQRISVTGNSQLILDTQFSMGISTTGNHISLPGYGDKDYSRYNEKIGGVPVVQVKFPFPVFGYKLIASEDGSGVEEAFTYFKANTWISTLVGESSFIIPSWAGETDFSAIRARSIAINARSEEGAQEQFSHLEDIGWLSNFEQSQYVAYTEENVELSGRVYAASVIDVTDYPTWESVFRTDGLLNGFSYDSGIANQNGFVKDRDTKFTFPLVDGSHPNFSNVGTLKTGYKIRFKLETVGEMDDADDAITIKPTFYYVDKKTGEYYGVDGERSEVDVYYSETVNGTKQTRVKVGSDLDKLNTKWLSLSSGFDVDTAVLRQTAELLGYDGTNEFVKKRSATYTFDSLRLGTNLRVFVGDSHETQLENGNKINLYQALKRVYDEDKFDSEVGREAIRSVQNWYGEYYLPSEIWVVPKGAQCTDENALRDGYLVVNFEVVTENDGEPYLAYDATKYQIDPIAGNTDEVDVADSTVKFNYAGKCNMWSVEQYSRTKVDSRGVTFEFKDGDIVLYDLTSQGADDYSSGGTH